MNSMYEILMDLPLFQGVSHSKISELIEKIKFHFLKYLNGEQFIASGDVCSQLRFIISGKARIEILPDILTVPNGIHSHSILLEGHLLLHQRHIHNPKAPPIRIPAPGLQTAAPEVPE